MAKNKTMYVCQSCEHSTLQWLGQCPKCNEWNTLVETAIAVTRNTTRSRGSVSKPIRLSNVKAKSIKRISSNSSEFDRVLGGGFVPGQVVLLSGEPGVGKSTLLTQIAKNMGDKTVLYVCGEESVSQVKVRADRMKYKADNLLVAAITNTDDVIATIETSDDLGLIIVDSIQSLDSSEYMGVPGSVGQVRGGANKLTNVAKKINVPLILVGHVTKDGTVAGPKVLEHIVDTVLYLEGDAQHMFRVLKTTKNRFGAVSEVGIFEMVDRGMNEVANPSEIFLKERMKASPGSCVTVVMEGFRPILFEVQALTTKTSFGYPVRTASGLNVNRLKVLIAILEKRCNIRLDDQDVYVNVAGGFKVTEYACDLAICMAIASSILNKSIDGKTVAFGETGLLGELRHVPHETRRTAEAKKLGYTNIVSPQKTSSVKEAIDRLRASK